MIIIYGTKILRRKLGRVADFCPICRTITACELKSVSKASHLYYITIGGGDLIGHETNCESCGIQLSTKMEKYADVEKDAGCELPKLVTRTYPDITSEIGERLLVEDRLKSGGLTA